MVSDFKKLTGETDELNHFLVGGDWLMVRIEAQIAVQLINPGNTNSIKADLVCKIKEERPESHPS